MSGDYTDEIAEPSVWLDVNGRLALARKIELNAADSRAFVDDPDGFLQSIGPNGEDAWYADLSMAEALDAAFYLENLPAGSA